MGGWVVGGVGVGGWVVGGWGGGWVGWGGGLMTRNTQFQSENG